MAGKDTRKTPRGYHDSLHYARSSKPGSYTYCGAVFYELMVSREHSFSSFARAARGIGYKYAPDYLSRWCRGVNSFPTDFPVALDRILAFDDDELMWMAIAYSYGQSIPRDRRPEDLRGGIQQSEANVSEVEREKWEEFEPAEISEAGLKTFAEFRRYHRSMMDRQENQWEGEKNASGADTPRGGG